jgi:hypothetical protein
VVYYKKFWNYLWCLEYCFKPLWTSSLSYLISLLEANVSTDTMYQTNNLRSRISPVHWSLWPLYQWHNGELFVNYKHRKIFKITSCPVQCWNWTSFSRLCTILNTRDVSIRITRSCPEGSKLWFSTDILNCRSATNQYCGNGDLT